MQFLNMCFSAVCTDVRMYMYMLLLLYRSLALGSQFSSWESMLRDTEEEAKVHIHVMRGNSFYSDISHFISLVSCRYLQLCTELSKGLLQGVTTQLQELTSRKKALIKKVCLLHSHMLPFSFFHTYVLPFSHVSFLHTPTPPYFVPHSPIPPCLVQWFLFREMYMSRIDKTEDKVNKVFREYQDNWSKYAEGLEKDSANVKVSRVHCVGRAG